MALWWDEFGGSSLDASKWAYETDTPLGAREAGQLQVYTASPDNIWLADGNLHIAALKDGSGYTSGRINSRKSGSWHPGMQLPDGATLGSLHVEARIQVPSPGQGLWAAFWMSPPSMMYGGWPQSGEIDMMGGINSQTESVQGVHFGAQFPGNQVKDQATRQANGQPYSDGFHIYAIDWDRESITTLIDGVQTMRITSRQLGAADGWWTAAAPESLQAPFDIPFSIILNVAVGGNWPGGPDNSTPFPATMLVDYVRVWGAVDA